VSRIRTVFLGTPEIARHCLEGLIKDDHFEVVGVVTQPDRPAGRNLKPMPSPVKKLVESIGIPVISPESVNTPEVLQTLSDWRAEAAVVVAYGQIVSQEFLDLFPRRVVNVHASLLPRWRGAAPIQRALMAGDRETGVSLQVMVKKLDAGDVIGFRKFQLDADMNAIELLQALTALAIELVRVDFMDYLRGNLSAIPQDEALVTYAPKIDKSEAKIRWEKPAVEIHNLVRGLAMNGGAVARVNGKNLKIHRTRVVSDVKVGEAEPGEIVISSSGRLVVACADQAVELTEVQPESRSRLSIGEYLKGYPLHAGEKFESLEGQ